MCEDSPAIGKILIECVMAILLSKTGKVNIIHRSQNFKKQHFCQEDYGSTCSLNCVLLASPLITKKPPKIDVAAPTVTEGLTK